MDFELLDYSEKSFVVVGNTIKYKNNLSNLGGSYCSRLKDKYGNNIKGWIFPLSRKNSVKEWSSNLKNGYIVLAPPVKKIQTVKWRVQVPKKGMTAILIHSNPNDVSSDNQFKFPITDIIMNTEGNVVRAYCKKDNIDHVYIITEGTWMLWGYNKPHKIVFKYL